MQIFIDLIQRHEQSFYSFVHKVHSKGAGLFDSLTKWVEREEELEPKLIASVHQTMEIFLMLARDSRGHAFKMAEGKKVSPAEFIAIVVLIHVWKSKLGSGALKKAIRDMRRSVRDQEHDIRTNKRVMELLWTFIRAMNGDSYRKPDETPATKLRPLKRKRRDDDEMSVDSEERKPPSRRKVAPKQEEDSMPTVSQAHTMASRRQPALPSSSRPSAPSTPTAPPQAYASASHATQPSYSAQATQPSTVTPAPQQHNRLAALHAVRQFGQDVPSSQSGSPRTAPHIPAPSFSSSAGPPPFLSQAPSNQSADEQKAHLASQQLMLSGNAACPSTIQYPKASGPPQTSQQQSVNNAHRRVLASSPVRALVSQVHVFLSLTLLRSHLSFALSPHRRHAHQNVRT